MSENIDDKHMGCEHVISLRQWFNRQPTMRQLIFLINLGAFLAQSQIVITQPYLDPSFKKLFRLSTNNIPVFYLPTTPLFLYIHYRFLRKFFLFFPWYILQAASYLMCHTFLYLCFWIYIQDVRGNLKEKFQNIRFILKSNRSKCVFSTFQCPSF